MWLMLNEQWGKTVGNEDRENVSRGLGKIVQGLAADCKELFLSVCYKPGTEDMAAKKTAKVPAIQSLLLVDIHTYTHTHTRSTSPPHPFLILQQLHHLSPVSRGSKTIFYGK